MRRFLPLLAVWLVALWLPATQHCTLEAAGLIPATCPDEHGAGSDSECHTTDGCDTVEGAAYKPCVNYAKVIPPVLTSDGYDVCLEILQEHSALSTDVRPSPGNNRPRDWIPSWQFIRRAAPLSRAPSLLG